MTIDLPMASVLGLAAVAAIVRLARHAPRWRLPLAAGQVACAVLLYVLLAESPDGRGDDRLVVITAGATPAQRAALDPAATIVALPDAATVEGAAPVPDLATALRRSPSVRELRVVGDGLPARDRDAARGIAVRFDPAPSPVGIVDLQWPSRVVAGQRWALSGRVAGVPGARLQLADPAGSVVAKTVAAVDGSFVLEADSRQPGRALFELDRMADEAIVERVPIALSAVAADHPVVLLLSGGPDPEQKYLRRWALDAGVDLRARVGLSERVALLQGQPKLGADDLRAIDLVVVDERSWSALGGGERAALVAAVNDGLGLLLRATGPLPAATASDWKALGFEVTAADLSTSVTLAAVTAGAPSAVAADDPSATALSRRPLKANGRDATRLVGSAANDDLALWRAQGQGRVGLWWLDDSWRLVLDGHAARYDSLWGGVLARLGRARGEAAPEALGIARRGERVVFCGLAGAGSVTPPSGEPIALLVDPATGDRRCAGFWPRASGWHALALGATTSAFYVLDDGVAPGWIATQRREATRALAAEPSTSPAAVVSAPSFWPPSRRYGFLAWLAIAALLWWAERRVRLR